ncbi:hypothetical protein ABZ802_31510 [Streptomyces sp. NPDC047737]|uniref:hypothetical protein n=1 Tax=Streptomyces sp. NPDC047737 TaxID=3155740 RepID=UPI0033DBD70A
MTDDDVATGPLLPYPPGTQWRFTSRNRRVTQTHELALRYGLTGADDTDDYLADEISASTLWKRWADQYADADHRHHPGRYRRGEVHIDWTVVSPQGTFEASPHVYGHAGEDFLTHYTHPTNPETGERLNWVRLPVIDLGWHASASDRGGFIQQATGWRPSPLQPTMDVRQIGAAAGLYVPPL